MCSELILVVFSTLDGGLRTDAHYRSEISERSCLIIAALWLISRNEIWGNPSCFYCLDVIIGVSTLDSQCRVCGSFVNQSIFSAKLLNRTVNYFDCPKCRYVQTQEPEWLDQAYSSAINNCDTGIMVRNLANSRLVAATLHSLGLTTGTVVDCAGGYGILVRLLRDRGIDAYWSDPYCKNALAVGFEFNGESADLVTAFEAFEHFVNPEIELKKLFEIAPNVLLSTELIAAPAPAAENWWYYGLDHGQHIGFFRVQTLQYLAERFHKNLCTDGRGRHLFSDKPISTRKWKTNTLIERFIPGFFSRNLPSRVWSDFELMSRAKK